MFAFAKKEHVNKVIVKSRVFIYIAANVHALAMAGQFITFCRNVCTVNEQKAEIFILLLNRVFSARIGDE